MDIKQRKMALERLKSSILKHENAIVLALKSDFNKCEFDAYSTEIGMVLHEISYFTKHLKSLAKAKKVHTSIMNFPARGIIYAKPLGRVLIIAPWNYPFQLSMLPLVGAIAAGNEVVLKPSTKTQNTYKVICDIIKDSQIDATVTDSRQILDQKFDFIFFTGGAQTGREVALKAAQNLTPICLELGGKSPVIIDDSADIAIAARRIAWGKFLNGGQTCVAPDYVLVPQHLAQSFTQLLIEEVKAQFYVKGQLSADFTHLINQNKADEVVKMLECCKSEIVFGGDINGRIMHPTVLKSTTESVFMKDEIFAPVLPIVPYADFNTAIGFVKNAPTPLALYYFGSLKQFKARGIQNLAYGGGCVNDVVMHLTERNLPFGGMGQSGMGSYHAQKSFELFSHYSSVLIKGKNEIKARYMPYADSAKTLVKKILK